jgi:RNA polymerase-binding transcription factor DksA
MTTITGGAAMMTSLGEEEARVLLQEEQARLQQIRVSLQTEPLDGGPEERAIVELSFDDQHPADVATDTFEREKDMSILEHVDAQLSDVDRALGRLEQGTYGTCEACGRPIDEDRLRARPAVRFCIEDQEMAERGVG